MTILRLQTRGWRVLCSRDRRGVYVFEPTYLAKIVSGQRVYLREVLIEMFQRDQADNMSLLTRKYEQTMIGATAFRDVE